MIFLLAAPSPEGHAPRAIRSYRLDKRQPFLLEPAGIRNDEVRALDQVCEHIVLQRRGQHHVLDPAQLLVYRLAILGTRRSPPRVSGPPQVAPSAWPHCDCGCLVSADDKALSDDDNES